MLSRGTSGSSHLREVSAASPDRDASSTPDSQVTNISTSRPPLVSAASLTQRFCTLWVHDESFSREEVLFNLGAFSELAINVGDLVEVLPATARTRDSHVSSRHSSTGMRSASDAASPEALPHDDSGTPREGFLFVVKPLPAELKARHPNLQLSIASNVANHFGFKNRMSVLVTMKERSQCSASHVELIFRDQFLLRADQWRLTMSELADRPVFKGQKVLYMGTIKATVKSIYRDQKKVQSAYFSPGTIPIFRSESARYVVFVQMSREMWDFDAEGTGDILFSRVINSLLPELFKRWAAIDAHHLITVVLFTKVEYDHKPYKSGTALRDSPFIQPQDDGRRDTQDFYRVVVNDMPCGNWTAILDLLKSEFRVFLRDVSIPQASFPDTMVSAEDVIPRADNDPPIIAGHPTSSVHGNILEAINVASSYLEYEHSGRDLTRTGTSVIVITPGPGVFEVAYDALALTSEVLTSRAIGLDLICLSPQPLHAVPLFKYKPPAQPRTDRPQSPNKTNGLSAQNSFTSVSASPPRHMDTSHGADDWVYGMPHWIDISFWDPKVYHETGMAVNRIMRSSIPGTITKQSQMFTPRVRMYEIQMMGIMESEQSNISIPYLASPESTSNKPSRDATGLRHHLEATNVPIGSLCCSSDGEMLLASKRLTKMFMESYDKQAFHTGLKRRNIQQPRHDDRGMFDPSSIRVPEKQHAHHVQRPRRPDPRALLSDHRPPVSRSGPLHVNTNEPKPGMKSSMKAPGSRSSGLSRKISFALRGLGPTPPRAVASTEINAENASAMTPLTQQTQMSNPKSQDPLSSSISKPTVEPTFSRPQASQRVAAPPRIKRQSISQPSEPTPARPISIRQNVGKSKQTDESEGARSYETRSYGTSLAPTLGSSPYAKHDAPLVQSRVFPFRRTGPKLEPPAKAIHPTTDPVKALAPWIISINPCRRKGPVRPSWFGRWQHVYARMPHASSVKWKSLKSPAILPLTTEEFPTKEELASDYSQTPYRVGENDESETREDKKSREALLAEMIGLRLSHGFQIVVGRAVEHTTGQASLGTLNIFNTAALSEGGLPIFMTMGNIIHRLVCVGGGEIEVTRYTRKNSTLFMDQTNLSTSYTPAVKTILSIQYCKSTVSLRMPKEDYNWNYVDSYIAGYRDHLWDPEKQLRFWCARFVLIPVQIPTHVRRPMLSLSEDNEEEIHLLGINQLTRMWQKNRYVLPEEKRILSKYRKEVQNPLNIIFQTSNPSEVVAAELGRLLIEGQDLDTTPAQLLLPDSELFERSNFSLSRLAQVMQGEDGIRMMDRRWHFRLHYNCFVGGEFTTWMLQNFKDIDSREEAVDFGNELMKHGLFRHVRQEHNFRDGNYFYQISEEYQLPRPESKSTWFPRKTTDKTTDKSSTPSTPASDGPATTGEPQRGETQSSTGEQSSASTVRGNRARASVFLSKCMKYDLDPRKRSGRPEIIDLHYDRLHNPDNCFHFQLSWLNATPKLIEDAVASWSSTAEKYGLRLVEVPMSEASAIVRTQVFRRPYPIKLKIKPPDYVNPVINSPSSFTSQKTNDKLFYHKAILKKFDFVLDFESSKSFSADVDVQYSWGRPTYNYHQYIHRSGCVLAQITDEGCFLLAANHLFTTRMSTREASRLERDHNRPRASTLDLISPRLSPITPAIGREGSEVSSPLIPLQVDPQNVFRATAEIRDEMTKFCSDERQLRQFYATEAAIIAQGSIGGRAESSRPYNRGEPYSEPPPSSTTDSSIPTLELPERLFPSNLSNSLRYGLSRPTSSGRTSSRKPSVDSAMYDARAMSDSTRGPQSPSK